MDPRIIILLLFIGFPLLELYLLIKLGAMIGAISTIFLIVFTGVFGALLLRQQGLSSMSRVRKSMERGEPPALNMFESLFVFIAAIFLIIPGLITDIIGLFLLLTPIRLWLIRKILGLPRFKQPPSGGSGPVVREDSQGKITIDGEYTREDDPSR